MYRCFIGVTKINKNKFTYILTVFDDKKKVVTTVPKTVTDKVMDYHRCKLLALLDFLNMFDKNDSNCEVCYYANEYSIMFEWHQEYMTNHQFSLQTKDQDLWKQICNKCIGNHISLCIKENSSCLEKLGEIYG